MSHRLRVLPVALFLAAACSDGNGPRREPSDALLVLRTQAATQSLWRYDGARARRITGDSVRFIFEVARADDGRIASLGMRVGNDGRYTLTETAPDGTVLRTVLLGPTMDGFGPPRELSYSPDGRRLAWRTFVGGSRTDSLYLLDAGATAPRGLAFRQATEEVPEGILPAPPLRWTPAGRIVFGPPRTLVAYDPQTRDTLMLAANAGYISDYDFANDGRLAMVTRSLATGTGRIVTQRAIGGPLIQIPGSAEANPWFVRWHQDARRVGTTTADSVFAGGFWYGLRVPQVMSIDGSTAPVPIPGLDVSALHGWTTSGALVMTGQLREWIPAVPNRDVFLGTTAGTFTNLTNTPAADESRVLVVR